MGVWGMGEEFSFSQFEGALLDTPMTVLASELTLNSFIDRIGETDLKILWLGTSKAETAFRLSEVHLVELVETKDNEITIELTNSGFRFLQ